MRGNQIDRLQEDLRGRDSNALYPEGEVGRGDLQPRGKLIFTAKDLRRTAQRSGIDAAHF